MTQSSRPAYRQQVIFLALAAAILFSGIWCLLLYRTAGGSVREYNPSGVPLDTGSLTYSIDRAYADHRNVTVQGWAVMEGEDLGFFENHILLKRQTDSRYYLLRTEWEHRPDVSDALGGEYSYDNCGFYSRNSTHSLEPGSYQICILYESNQNHLLCETSFSVRIP